MNDYSDLYGDALTEVIKLECNPTLDIIRSYFSELDEMERTFEYNGKKIITQRKFTYRGMRSSGKMYEVKTNYLHVWVQIGTCETTMIEYVEKKDGTFRTA